MGEMYSSEAEAVRRKYAEVYQGVKAKIQMNFEDMDFDNAMQRDEMEDIVNEMKAVCDEYIKQLNELSFL